MTYYGSGIAFGATDLGEIAYGEEDIIRVADCDETIFASQKAPFESDVLIVAGGGGGGLRVGGGGGAGGYREGKKVFYTDVKYTVTVGAGGAGANDGPGLPANGSDSSVERVATGGGGGASNFSSGSNGGSGGGVSSRLSGGTIGSSTRTNCTNDVQGNDGGSAGTVVSDAGGGGGGSGAAGSAGSGDTGGNGGNGTASSITGSSVTRAGGGGATHGILGGTRGTGGSGGGGDGAATTNTNGGDGAVNTGGGGGGAGDSAGGGHRGGNGGSGFVCIKYPNAYTITVGAGLTSSTATSGDYKITQFTAGTDNISFTGNDPYFNSVSFIFEDTSTDLSNSNISMTFGSDTSLDTFAKVGTHSMKFTPSGTSANNRVTLATDSDLDMAAGDFTFECWFYLNNVSQDGWARLISNPNGDANTSIIYYFNGLMRIYNGGAGNPLFDFAGTTVITKAQWNHLALTRNGNTMTLWINGSSNATHTAGASEHYSFSGAAFGDDINNTLNDNEWNGYIDHVRITKGVARYTSSFTPTTNSY